MSGPPLDIVKSCTVANYVKKTNHQQGKAASGAQVTLVSKQREENQITPNTNAASRESYHRLK